jgi:peptidylprolyl isomerase domain and WD repeat-containing protein 1
MSVAKQGDKFAVCATNRTVYVFHFNSGKILHKFEESAAYYGTEEASNISCLGEGFDMGSRLSQQVELEKETAFSAYKRSIRSERSIPVLWLALGIKMVNMNNGAVERVLCQQDDSERFLHLALYQGVPKVDKQYLLSKSKDVGRETGQR